ncbi:MAG: hypothetical protein CMJ76_04540 [Planctomycetaceae bacterium]|nr:hypothetical protein [Planctomycetaceae bacterium]
MKPIILTSLIFLTACQTTFGDPQDDALLLEGLQQRGLFSLVEYQCRSRIKDPDSSERTKMEWTVHLINSVIQQALRQSAEQRDEFWEDAQDEADDYVTEHLESPFNLHVKLQAALALTANGELLRLESTISKTAAAQREKSREQLRLAVRALTDLDNQIQEFLPRVTQDSTDEAPSQSELLSLRQNLQYHLARTYRNQANTYASGTNDQIASLQRAVTALNKPLTQLSEEDPLVIAIHLAMIACHRDLKQFDQAQAAIEKSHKLALSAKDLMKLRAETVRLALAQRDLETTLELLHKPRESKRLLVPEYELALLDAFIYFWGKATKEKNPDGAENYQQQAVLTVKHIEQIHGPYWGRVAELQLLKHAGMNGDNTNLAVLERTADDLYRKDKFTEAIDAYDATADAAQAAGNNDLAFRVLYKTALIEQKRNNNQAYIERLTTTGIQLRNHPQAAAVHMLGIRAVIEILNKDASRQQEFETLLAEHLTYFDSGSSVDQAAIWLGTLQQRRQSFAQAIASYMAISPDYQNYITVIQNLEFCWSAKLKQNKSDNQLTDVKAFIDHLKSLIFDSQGKTPQQWTSTQRYAATTLAGILVTYSSNHYDEAETLLAAASTDAIDEDWLALASSLRIVSLAAQGRDKGAREHIDQILSGKTSQWIQTLKQLQTVATGAPESTRIAIARIQIELFKQLSPKLVGVKPDFRSEWELLEAEAYMQSGNLSESIEHYQTLALKNPRHGLIQLRYAQALTKSDAHYEKGLVQWRRVLQGNPPKSDRWYEAKFNIASLYMRNGKQDEAKKQIRYLEVTSGFGIWEKQFRTLLKRGDP